MIDLPPLDRLRTQDHDAFDALVAASRARIARYLARLVGDAEVAADLTQDTFLRAYQALPALADDSDVGAWIYRIATNLARQHHRHGQLLCWQRLEPHHAPSRSLEDDVARRDDVHRALSRLTL
ncbi:MAG TPA: sigma factor, partial [Chloroflexota bacterium]|nr:sigma factor [Chloroflexota bacterium]